LTAPRPPRAGRGRDRARHGRGDLLAGLRDRGLDVTRPILVVIDGAKAPLRAVNDMFDHPIVQRWASRAEVNPGQATDGEPAS
jgi:hypothetical protein